jgi:hypothetical protein
MSRHTPIVIGATALGALVLGAGVGHAATPTSLANHPDTPTPTGEPVTRFLDFQQPISHPNRADHNPGRATTTTPSVPPSPQPPPAPPVTPHPTPHPRTSHTAMPHRSAGSGSAAMPQGGAAAAMPQSGAGAGMGAMPPGGGMGAMAQGGAGGGGMGTMPQGGGMGAMAQGGGMGAMAQGGGMGAMSQGGGMGQGGAMGQQEGLVSGFLCPVLKDLKL